MNAQSNKTAVSKDLEDRVRKLSSAKRALLERRLARSGASAAQTDRLATPASWSSLVPIQAVGSQPPFFWIHGENSTFFLPRFLGPDQPLYGVLHQSRDGRRARYTTVEAMAAHYLSEIRTAQPEGPYFLGGFCIGGTIAVEIARSLRAEGKEVALVIIVDPAPPREARRKSSRSKPRPVSRSSRPTLTDRLDTLRHRLVAQGFGGKFRLIVETASEKAAMLPAVASQTLGATAAKFTAAVGHLKKLGAVTAKFTKRLAGKAYYWTGVEPIPAKLVTFYLDAVYHRAIREYQGCRYDGEVVVLSTQEVPSDPQGFDKFIDALKIVEIDAIHSQVMYEAPQIQIVAEMVKSYLEKVQSGTAGAVIQKSDI